MLARSPDSAAAALIAIQIDDVVGDERQELVGPSDELSVVLEQRGAAPDRRPIAGVHDLVLGEQVDGRGDVAPHRVGVTARQVTDRLEILEARWGRARSRLESSSATSSAMSAARIDQSRVLSASSNICMQSKGVRPPRSWRRIHVGETQVIDARLGIVVHPGVAAARAAAQRLRPAAPHLDSPARNGERVEDLSRRLVHAAGAPGSRDRDR
ncbi:MAG: hypothetical protein U0610_07345 [bacterium]